jgi:hypothetical protein
VVVQGKFGVPPSLSQQTESTNPEFSQAKLFHLILSRRLVGLEPVQDLDNTAVIERGPLSLVARAKRSEQPQEPHKIKA